MRVALYISIGLGIGALATLAWIFVPMILDYLRNGQTGSGS